MRDPFSDFAAKALTPMMEQLEWIQDKPPHTRATIDAVVLMGQQGISSAGIPLDALTADSWTVHAPPSTIIVDRISIGDTLRRLTIDAVDLTVQRVIHETSGWWILCTAKTRAKV